MIRRDYLLRMIDQCIQALTRSLRLKEEGQLEAARDEVEQAVRGLADLSVAEAVHLADTELAARLLQNEPTQVLPPKAFMLVALLHRAGEISQAQGQAQHAQACFLKALNLQIDVLLREGVSELPDFVPSLELLLRSLPTDEVPAATQLRLMQFQEQSGQFAKAEDTLFRLLDAVPADSGIASFGLQFYERLLRQTDEALELGGLPRAEVEAGMAHFQSTLTAKSSASAQN